MTNDVLTFIETETPKLNPQEIAWLDQASARLSERLTLDELLDAWNESDDDAYARPIAEMDSDEQRLALLIRLGGAMALVRVARP